MTQDLKAYRERKKILEALWLNEDDMERIYQTLGRDEKFIQDMKAVREVLDMQLFAWEKTRMKVILWQLAVAVLAAIVGIIAARL